MGNATVFPKRHLKHRETSNQNLFQTTIKKRRGTPNMSKVWKFIIEYEFFGLKLDPAALDKLERKNCLKVAKFLKKLPFL